MRAASGVLEQIHLVRRRRGVPRAVKEALLEVGRGLPGDHHEIGRSRPLTLIAAEALEEVASLLGVEVKRGASRRNLTVRGVPLEDHQFGGAVLCIGEARLLIHGSCDPCLRMEKAIGKGAQHALDGRGGLVASVLTGGRIRVGDAVRFEGKRPAIRVRGSRLSRRKS